MSRKPKKKQIPQAAAANQQDAVSARRICVYCDSQLATTRDQAVSRALFDVLPSGYLHGASLQVLQRRKAKDEPYFRDYITVDIHNHDHPTARTGRRDVPSWSQD